MKKLTTLAAILLLLGSSAHAQVKLGFDLGQRGQRITEDHYGIFYEEINHAGDGGLYAELIRNRSFEDNVDNPDTWWTVGGATMSITTDNMLNTVQGHAMRLEITAAGGGVRNEGFWGINIVAGRQYTLSFWLRGDNRYEGTLKAELQNADGVGLGHTEISVSALQTWKKYTATITATGSDTRGYLALLGSDSGVIVLDVVSLFPPTYKNRPNGCRLELAQMLADLHPRFMRFPGGCFIEGWASGGVANRFEWKKSIGPIEERPGHMNLGWGYRVTDGLGYHELLQLAEDLGAAPMFVVNMGIGHDWSVDENDIGPFIQEALDAIEYANGTTDTFYGRMRAENGHPEPFNLKYLEIGNEQEFMLSREAYLHRYMQFYRAIKTRWPDLHLIADSYYFDNVTEPVELKDEHYYSSPSFFISQYGRYDNQSVSSTKIYVGEYAVTQDHGWLGNLNAAIGEAVFMEGAENNGEAVTMMSYAPIFTHEEDYRWHPDMIRFNSSLCYGTPSYYVQRMFSNNVGKENVRWTETDNTQKFDVNHGAIGLGTWATSATFTSLSVTDAERTYTFTNLNTADWTTKNGSWTLSGNSFRQTNTSDTDVTCVYNTQLANSTLDMTVKATKNGGNEGFLIIFDYKDAQNYSWLNLGGWGNTQHAVEQCKNGAKTTLGGTGGSLTTGREYTIRIVKDGNHVTCYMDGTAIIDTDLSGYGDRSIYTSANIDDDTNTLYVKLVNPSANAEDVTMTFRNGRATSGEAEVLSSPYGTDENSVNNPFYITPKTRSVSVSSNGSITFQCAAFSVNVLRIHVEDVVVPQAADLPTPLLRYSFDNGTADDSGRFTGTLIGQATVEQLADGNRVLVTGRQGEGSYMTIPVETVREALGSATDFTISLNILQRLGNNLGNYCWAFDMDNGMGQYLGIINAGGNQNWYFQVKNDETVTTVDSWSCLTIGDWHNITYTQESGTGRIYIDGQLRGTNDVALLPRDFIDDITTVSLGHSPFAADAIIENALFDDVQIFDKALSAEQIKEMAQRATSMEYTGIYDGIADIQDFEQLIKEVKNYYEDADCEALTNAYEAAKESLNDTEDTQRQCYAQLRAAVNDYQQQQWQKARNGEAANLTFLITNSSFTRYNVGWQGLDIPASHNGTTYAGYENETTEKFNCPFDIWQEIDGLPEGDYTLSCSAFYRTGGIEAAYEAYQKHTTDTQLAKLYMNKKATTVLNLFSCDDYTYSPYTYPDNLSTANEAFNAQHLYDGNSVSIHLNEGETLRVGLRKLQTVVFDWVAFDNFRLRKEGTATAVISQHDSHNPVVRTELYSLDGRRLSTQQRGVGIVKKVHADGSVTIEKRLW